MWQFEFHLQILLSSNSVLQNMHLCTWWYFPLWTIVLPCLGIMHHAPHDICCKSLTVKHLRMYMSMPACVLLTSWFTYYPVVSVSPFPEAKVMRWQGFDQNLPVTADLGLAISPACLAQLVGRLAWTQAIEKTETKRKWKKNAKKAKENDQEQTRAITLNALTEPPCIACRLPGIGHEKLMAPKWLTGCHPSYLDFQSSLW